MDLMLELKALQYQLLAKTLFLHAYSIFFTNRKSLWRHDLLSFEAKSYLQQLLVGSNFLLGTFGVFEGPKKNLDSRPAKPPCD